MASLHLQDQKLIRLPSPLKIWEPSQWFRVPVVSENHTEGLHIFIRAHTLLCLAMCFLQWLNADRSTELLTAQGEEVTVLPSFLCVSTVQKSPFFPVGTLRYRVPGLDFISCLQSLLFTHLWNVSSLHWNLDDMPCLYLPPAWSWFIKSPAGAVKSLWRDMAAHLQLLSYPKNHPLYYCPLFTSFCKWFSLQGSAV